ncbi:MAG: leucine-rich repeat protein, partial [Clostridiales bacterium]|nr:leucine-rich repeat protein [Clostridiales bacterium]
KVTDAKSYVVKIGDKTYPAQSNTLDLSKITNVTTDKITVQAVGNNASESSLWSDEYEVRTSIKGTVKYESGIVSWRPVLNVSDYTVKVNGTTVKTITDGKTSTRITLTKAGDNKITVSNANETEEINVYAYTVKFDTQGAAGMSVADKYVAIGDELVLPEPPEASGYEFAGWYNSVGGANGNGQKLDKTTVFNTAGDLMLFANWNNAKYAVNLNYGDGRAPTGSTGQGLAQYRSDFEFEVPTPNDARYIFLGWFSAPTGGIQYTDERGKSVEEWANRYGGTAYARYIVGFDFAYLENSEAYSVVKNSNLSSSTIKHITLPVSYNDGVHGEKYVRVIDSNAFSYCSNLESISIPNTVTTIEVDSSAFYKCSNLKEVTIYEAGNSDPVYSSANGALIAFNERTSDYELKFVPQAVVCEDGVYTVPDVVEAIPAYAFRSCEVSKIIIPTGVRNIYANAIYDCQNLADITFSKNVENKNLEQLVIEESAIRNCGLLSGVTLPAHISGFNSKIFNNCKNISKIDIETNNRYYIVDDMLVESADRRLIYFPIGKEDCNIDSRIAVIGANAFYQAAKLTSVEIPAWITKIESGAFESCTALAEVTFKGPEDADSSNTLIIDERAFYGCKTLTSVDFQTGTDVRKIGDSAFYNCSALKSIDIPNTVTEIGDNAFYSCTGLASVTLGSGLTTIGAQAFMICSALTEIDLPESLTRIGDSAFARCNKLSRIDFPASLEEIGDSAFISCSALKTIGFVDDELGADLSIGDSAFNGCTGLTSFYVPKYAVSINSGFLRGCRNITTVTCSENNVGYMVEDNVIYELDVDGDITGILFVPTTKTGEFRLPAKLTRLGDGVFQNNTSIVRVVIPSGITLIGEYAFSGCTNLREVVFETDENNENHADITMKKYAFYNCKNLESINLPEGLVYIGTTAFNSCESLSSITIPSTVKTLSKEGYASNLNNSNGSFYGCTKLASVTFAHRVDENGALVNDLTTIGKGTFYNCTSLGSIEIPAKVHTIENSAFDRCLALTTVTFEDSTVELTIDNGTTTTSSGGQGGGSTTYNGAFSYCTSLINIELPDRLKRIPDYAFYGCASLTSINIAGGIHDTSNTDVGIGIYAFYGCSALTSVTYATNDAVDANDAYAYHTDKEISTGGLSIGMNAFAECTSLVSVALPKRLAPRSNATGTNAGEKITSLIYVKSSQGTYTAFTNDYSLERFVVESGCAKYVTDDQGLLYSAGYKTLLICPRGKTSVVIDSRVQFIETDAFYQAIYLTEVLFEEDTKAYTDSHTAEQKAALNDLVFNDKDGTYSYGAFYSCTALESISFPARLKTLGIQAFYKCTALSEVEFAANCRLTSIGKNAFDSAPLISIAIPKNVVSVGDNAFKDTSITSVTAPQDIVIESRRIGLTKLTDVTVYASDGSTTNPTEYLTNSNGDTLTWYSPTNTATSFTVPKGITAIGESAFYGNPYLQSVTFAVNDDGNSTLQTIGNYTFYGCTALKSITIPNTVTAIGDYAFSYCTDLGKGVVADESKGISAGEGVIFAALSDGKHSIQSFGREAFSYCSSLGAITIPGSVVKLGTSNSAGAVFRDTGLVTVTFAEAEVSTAVNFYSGSTSSPFYNCKSLVTVNWNNRAVSLPTYFFTGCTSLTTVTGIDKVTTFNTYLFNNCSSLQSITIPNGVTSLPNNCFYGCKGLQTVDLNKVTTLGTKVFQNCTGLQSITIPSGLTKLSDYTFDGCTGLQTISMDGVTSFGTYVFQKCTSLQSITIPSGVTSLSNYCFNGCTGLQTVDLNNVTTLGTYVFQDCSSLGSIDLSKVTSLGTATANVYTFKNCSNLTSVTLPTSASFTAIPKYCFQATGLTEVTIPANVTTIANCAFYNCKGLQTLNFASGTKTLTITDATSASTGAFSGCSELTTVDFGGRTINGCKYAFANCTNLTDVDLTGATLIAQYMFDGCTGLESVTIPASVATLNLYAFRNCSNLETVEFEESASLLTIPAANNAIYAPFYGTALGTVDFGKRKISIGTRAFYGLSSLSTVENMDNVTNIGDYAFDGCGIIELVLPSSPVTLGIQIFHANESLTKVTINTDAITAITNYMFSVCPKLSEVVFVGEGTALKSIGISAFHTSSSLTSIVIPEYITSIGNSAFNNSGLQTLTLPSTVTSYGSYVFANCANLQTVEFEIGDDMITELPTGLFSGCAKLEAITLPEEIVYIGDYALRGTGLKEMILHNGLTGIGNGAFADCEALTKVFIPATVTGIDGNPFPNCKLLTDLTIDDLNEYYTLSGALVYNKVPDGNGGYEEGNILVSVLLSASGTITITGDMTVSTGAFAGSAMKRVVVEEGVASIDDGMFNGCAELEEIVLPSTLASIGVGAFEGCVSLASITLPNSLISISDSAFEGCVSLEEVILPNALVSIGDNVFAGCTALGTIELPNTVVSVGDNAFEGCVSLEAITLSTNLTILGAEAFKGCVSLGTIELPAKLAALKNNTFEDCSDLETVEFAEGSALNAIGSYVFKNSGITEITVPAGVTVFNNNQFSGTAHLAKVKFGAGEKALTIGGANSAFFDCAALQEVDFGGRKTYLLEKAFFNCANLTTVSWDDLITVIERYAFQGCASLADVTIAAGVYKVNTGAFSDSGVVNLSFGLGNKTLMGSSFKNTKIVELTLPANVRLSDGSDKQDKVFSENAELTTVNIQNGFSYIGTKTFIDCDKLSTVNIGNALRVIESSVFENCTALTQIYIPATVTQIGGSSFKGSGLVTVTFGESKKLSVLSSAFENCTALRNITLPNVVTSVSNRAFAGCTSLESFIIPADATSVDTNAFTGCTALNNVTFAGNKCVSIYANAFNGCDSLTSITLPAGIRTINVAAFTGCANLTDIYVPHIASAELAPKSWAEGWNSGATIHWGASAPVAVGYDETGLAA